MHFKQRLSFLLVKGCILFALMAPCEARSSGAASEACVSMRPQHGTAQPQTTPNPYRILLSATQYVAGGTITVTLTGPSFRGFLIQARRVGQSTPVGTWESLPPNTRAMVCSGLADSATHANSQTKTSLTFTWRAPAANVGTVEFVATVVQSFAIFWDPLRSSQVTVVDACSSSPCLNGGACTSFGSTSYQCSCRTGFSGVRCQTQTVGNACISNPCFNSGACVLVGSSGYRCDCQSGFTGTRCETTLQTVDACSSSPCLNGGVCTSFGSTSYQCSCQAGFSGAQCQTQTVGNACISNPCFNSGACVLVGSSGYRCDCQSGFTGTRCETTLQTVDACSSSPCLNGGACTSFGSTSYQCSCPTGFSGAQCQIQSTLSDVCSLNLCRNGATCISTGANSYLCECREGTSGPSCETLDNACGSAPCLNGGQCAVSGSGYQCTCQAEFTGPRCATRITACTSNPCLNGGQCSIVAGSSSYQCSCPTGYSGTRCEITPCSSSPCFNNGQCSPSTGTPLYQCSCPVGYSGLRCETSACTSNPCLNGGRCILTGTSYRCTCGAGYSGTRCELLVSTGSCTPNPCFNGGQCTLVAGGEGYQCNCPNDFVGPDCHQPRDPCSPNPCQNGGSCSSPSSTSFQCRCADGWAGVDCATPSQVVCEQANICRNGGTCEPNSGGSFICRCPEGFDGVDCSRMISPCFPNPCENGGMCTVRSEESFSCNCTSRYSGIICQIEDLCDPSPCNKGVCQQAAGDPNYTCTCHPAYMGSNCDTEVFCNPNPCVNGVCQQDDEALNYSCQCNLGFTGRNCDEVRETACETNPCMNSGICLEIGDGFDYECACLVGYQGSLCEEAVIPVFQNCPESQTFPLEPGQSSANVTLNLRAIVPGAPDANLEVVSGPDIPGLVRYSDEYRLGKEVVIKATSETGTTAECMFFLRMRDEEPPTVNCPQDINEFTYGSSKAVEWSPATASDNLASSSDMTIRYSMDSGSFFLANEEASPVTIEVTAVDTFGNVGSCEFKVTVIKIPNAPPPVFTGCREGETMSYQLRHNSNLAFVSINIQATDSSQQPAFITQVEGPAVFLPGDVEFTEEYRQGQKFVFRALDPETDLTADCTFWIELVDKQPPEVRCPSNVFERTTADSKAIFWPPVSVEDNLPLPEDFIRSDRINGTVFDATTSGLSHIVTVTATDSFDNVGSCQFSVTLYKFDIVCAEFPTIASGTGDCVIAPDGKMECRVSCHEGYEYAPVDNRFKCQITSTKAFWEPLPNVNACIRPTAGSAISKTVTAVFPFDAGVCDASNTVFMSNIKSSIQSSLSDADLCENGLAQACTPDSVVPMCGVAVSSGITRKRRAFTDLTVSIEVSAPASDSQGSSLTEVQRDIDDLAASIKEFADMEGLSLIIDHQMVYSLSSEVSEDYKWTCPDGYKSVQGGCVSCPPGTYFYASTRDCIFCEQGSYQDESRQLTCIPCPSGKSTDQTGSDRSGQCQTLVGFATSVWSPFLISMVVITIAFLVVLFIGVICICVCVPSKRDRRYGRDKDIDGSLSNLKYLNRAYEEEYTKRRSVGMHKLARRQTSPSRASTATGYITMSTSGRSSTRNQADMVSIDSDEYHPDVHGRQAHFNRGNTIERDSGVSYGHVSTATLASSGGGFNSSPQHQVPASNTQMRRELPDTGL